MACDVIVQVKSYNPDTKTVETRKKTIKKGIDDGELTINEVVDYIIQLPKADRTRLAAQLRAALVLPLTETDVKNHIFVSNTTIDEIRTKYGDLFLAYPNLIINPKDNYTIIACNEMKLNGSTCYGRVVASDGRPIFFIKGYYGALHFLQYLDIKGKIHEAFVTDVGGYGIDLKLQYSKYKEEYQAIVNKYYGYYKFGEELLQNFLNNKKDFKEDAKFLNSLLYEISGDYNPDLDKSDVQILMESIKLKTDNNFKWKFNVNELYDVLSLHYEKIISKEEFFSMNVEQLNEYLHSLFIDDVNLARAKVTSMSGGLVETTKTDEKVVEVTKKKIKEVWKELKSNYASLGITLSSLEKLIKDSPELAKGLLLEAFLNGITDKEGITHTNIKVDIKGLDPVVTYVKEAQIKEKVTPKKIIMAFPYSSVGEVRNFGYNTKYLYSPVKKSEDPSLDEDGMYKGVYVYKYYNPKTKSTHYAIARHIISPATYMHTFTSLDLAKKKINEWFTTQRILDYSLLRIKMGTDRPRTVWLDFKGLKEGLLLTTLDLHLPYIDLKRIPTIFKDILNGTVANFQIAFSGVEGIESMNTPEKAAAFIVKLYDVLKTIDKKSDIREVINNNLKEANKIVKEINEVKAISYLIEVINDNTATITYANNNGNDVQLDGKFSDGTAANAPTVATLENAVKYFNDKFNIDIKTLTASELKNFSEKNNLNLPDNIRAFVYNGNIYINSSNANVSDLFHEMSHIFLGLLKVKYPKAYTAIVEKYMEDPSFAKSLRYIDSTYAKFSNLDKIEEVIVDMIAKLMYKKKSLVDSFKGEEFIEDFNSILTIFPELMNDVLNSGLEFTGFMNSLMTADNMSLVKRNMKISLLVRSLINDGKIIEHC